MGRILISLLTAATLSAGDVPATLQFRHLYTFGSKDGIHPPKALNKKAARTALGDPESPYGLAFPIGVATDEKNRVWIADNGTSSIHVFDGPHGSYREIRRVPGLASIQPAGITSDRTGRVYVSDAASGNILVFDETGEFHRLLIPQRAGRLLESPTAIAVAENVRTIYIADPPRRQIVVLNQEGETAGSIPLPPGFTAPSSLTVVGGLLHVLGPMQHALQVMTQTGVLKGTQQWESVAFPSAFAHDFLRRRMFVANPRYMNVEVYQPDGASVGVFGLSGDGAGQFRRVDSLHVDVQGLVYVVDSRHGKVVVFGER